MLKKAQDEAPMSSVEDEPPKKKACLVSEEFITSVLADNQSSACAQILSCLF